MSAFYPSSTSSTGQLSLLQDMTSVDHCAAASGPHHPVASVFSATGLRAAAETDPGVVDRHSDPSLSAGAGGGRTPAAAAAAGFPPNFLSSYSGGDEFRDFPAASKVSPVGGSRQRHSLDDSNSDEFATGGLDLTGMHHGMASAARHAAPDVYKPAPAPVATVDHRPPAILHSPTSSSTTTSNHHPNHQTDQSHAAHLHAQQHQMLQRSADLLQQQQQQRQDELFMQQARQWYLHQSPSSSSAIDHHHHGELINGRSPGAVPPAPLFRHHDLTGGPPLSDLSPSAGDPPHCHWPPPPPTYNGPITQRLISSDPKELSPTQKTPDGVSGIPFYPWMAVVGWYLYTTAVIIYIRVKYRIAGKQIFMHTKHYSILNTSKRRWFLHLK